MVVFSFFVISSQTTPQKIQSRKESLTWAITSLMTLFLAFLLWAHFKRPSFSWNRHCTKSLTVVLSSCLSSGKPYSGSWVWCIATRIILSLHPLRDGDEPRHGFQRETKDSIKISLALGFLRVYLKSWTTLTECPSENDSRWNRRRWSRHRPLAWMLSSRLFF